MNGLIIYDLIGAKRNEWFINKLLSYAKARNLNLKLSVAEGADINLDKKTDFAIVRTIAPRLNYDLEKSGVKVFNNFKTSSVANNKWETYLMCAKLRIPTMNTLHNAEDAELTNFPYVIKSCSGHGGTEVYWAKSFEDYLLIKASLKSSDKDFIIQSPCSDLGRDMRIYLMGDKIIASVLRYNPNSFKSNYSLGGQVRPARPTDYQIKISKQIAEYLNSDYIGVDFIYDKGRWVLNEVEDVVGARMLYQTCEIDVAKDYIDYIHDKLF